MNQVIYLENKLGIRIENLVYIDGNNKNLFFKNLTFAPLEKDLIDENLLTKIEKDYIFYLSFRNLLKNISIFK